MMLELVSVNVDGSVASAVDFHMVVPFINVMLFPVKSRPMNVAAPLVPFAAAVILPLASTVRFVLV
jgi:hypothetical protein